MIHKVKAYIETNRLLTCDKPVIIGFSGGGDSVSLLFILNRLGYKCIAAHVNFHLRGDESDRDETFCRNFTDSYGIAFEKTDFDTTRYAAANHISIEMAARDLRYAWFESLRIKYDAQAIAVAHHADDSIETLLINLIRGTGIRGLRGIRPKNGYIVRPMLCVDAEEIKLFLHEQALAFITDSSNFSEVYTRNLIRLRLLPLLESINPAIRKALLKTAENLSDAEAVYSDALLKSIDLLTRHQGVDGIQMSIQALLEQPAPKTILYEWLKPYGFTSVVCKNIFRALHGGASGKIFKATSYQLLKDRDALILYAPENEEDEIYAIYDSETDRRSLPIDLSFKKIPVDETFVINTSPATATFDYGKLHFPLTLRKWQPGDWFIPFGMKGRQKLSDYFSDHKFSLQKKQKTWLLCNNQDIIWIIGHRTDNRFRTDKYTKNAFVINFFEKSCTGSK